MGKRRDYRGQRFGRLTAIEPSSAGARAGWDCVCDCGAETRVDTNKLTSGHTRSCGCWGREAPVAALTTHGATKGGVTPEYEAWAKLKSRCLNPNNAKYQIYGGRGISVCAQWVDDFGAFLSDVGPRPSSAHSIDRIDVDGNYEPGNCRWATPQTQSRNRTNNMWIEINGERMVAAEAADRFGVSRSAFCRRLQRGWTVEEALGPSRASGPRLRTAAR